MKSSKMKKLIYILTLLPLLMGSCEDEYTPIDEVNDVAWYTSETVKQPLPYKKQVGSFISFMDVSQGAKSHEWEVTSDIQFLQSKFDVASDSLWLFIDETKTGTKCKDRTIHAYLGKPGLQMVTLRNVFPEYVKSNEVDSLSVEAVQMADGRWMFERKFPIDVYGEIHPAFTVLKSDGTEVLDVKDDVMVNPGDSAKWPTVKVEAGDVLTFIDQTTDDRPNASEWEIKGSKATVYRGDTITAKFMKLGVYHGSTLLAKREQPDPVASARKMIPLKIEVIPSNKPYEFDGEAMQVAAKSRTISFSTTGEVGEIAEYEDFEFEVHVVNTKAGYDEIVGTAGISISSKDATKIELTLLTDIYNSDDITVSYNGTGIKSVDGRTFLPFTNVKVQMVNDAKNVLGAGINAGFESAGGVIGAAGWWSANNLVPYVKRSTDQKASGTASLLFDLLEGYETLGSYYTMRAGNFPVGTYVVRHKIFVDPATPVTATGIPYFIEGFNTSSHALYSLPQARGEWVTQEVVVDYPIVAGLQLKINIYKDPLVNAGGAKFYLDDIELIPVEIRP